MNLVWFLGEEVPGRPDKQDDEQYEWCQFFHGCRSLELYLYAL